VGEATTTCMGYQESAFERAKNPLNPRQLNHDHSEKGRGGGLLGIYMHALVPATEKVQNPQPCPSFTSFEGTSLFLYTATTFFVSSRS
jgi:hypothetical protein